MRFLNKIQKKKVKERVKDEEEDEMVKRDSLEEQITTETTAVVREEDLRDDPFLRNISPELKRHYGEDPRLLDEKLDDDESGFSEEEAVPIEESIDFKRVQLAHRRVHEAHQRVIAQEPLEDDDDYVDDYFSLDEYEDDMKEGIDDYDDDDENEIKEISLRAHPGADTSSEPSPIPSSLNLLEEPKDDVGCAEAVKWNFVGEREAYTQLSLPLEINDQKYISKLHKAPSPPTSRSPSKRNRKQAVRTQQSQDYATATISRKAGQPESTLHAWLISHGLSRHWEALSNLGAKRISDLALITKEDMDDLGFTPEERSRLNIQIT